MWNNNYSYSSQMRKSKTGFSLSVSNIGRKVTDIMIQMKWRTVADGSMNDIVDIQFW